MTIASFDELLRAATEQPEPQRLRTSPAGSLLESRCGEVFRVLVSRAAVSNLVLQRS